MERLNELQAEAVVLLEKLVATPSVSRDEARTADLLTGHLAAHGIAAERLYNNVYACAAHFDAANITASVFIFAGVILVVVGYKYYVRHGLPKLRSDGRLEH